MRWQAAQRCLSSNKLLAVNSGRSHLVRSASLKERRMANSFRLGDTVIWLNRVAGEFVVGSSKTNQEK
jgi:hypothetical protein